MNVTIIQKARNQVSQYQNYIEVFSFLIIANIFIAAAGWLTQVKIANTIGKESFGQVAFGMVIGSFGQVFIRVGLDSTLVRDLIHYPDRISDLVYGSLYMRFCLLLTGAAGLLAWKTLLAKESVNWGIILIILGWSMMSLDLQPVYDALHRIRLHTGYFLLQRSFYLTVIWGIILLFPGHLSVFTIGAVLIISVSIYLFLQHRWAASHLHGNSSSIRERFRTSLWLFRNNRLVWFTAMAGFMIGMLNQLVLKRYFGFKELGGYAAAWQFVTIGTLFIEQVSRIGRPEMARFTRTETSRHDRIRFLVRYSFTMTAIILPMAFAMAVFPHLLLTVLFKPEYHAPNAETALRILGIYLFTCSIGYVLSQYIIAMRYEKKYFLSVITGGALSIILCFLLIPEYGSTGAASALTLSYAATVSLFAIFTVLSFTGQEETS